MAIFTKSNKWFTKNIWILSFYKDIHQIRLQQLAFAGAGASGWIWVKSPLLLLVVSKA
jgi:hypothetical protein